MTRRPLPQRRASETFDLRFWSQPFTVTVGFFEDGTPGEVFSGIKYPFFSGIYKTLRRIYFKSFYEAQTEA